eukprot:1516357-Pyramimonas_sp.AAC.1
MGRALTWGGCRVPSRLAPQDSKASPASDMYSFAITLFEIFTRSEPYKVGAAACAKPTGMRRPVLDLALSSHKQSVSTRTYFKP